MLGTGRAEILEEEGMASIINPRRGKQQSQPILIVGMQQRKNAANKTFDN